MFGNPIFDLGGRIKRHPLNFKGERKSTERYCMAAPPASAPAAPLPGLRGHQKPRLDPESLSLRRGRPRLYVELLRCCWSRILDNESKTNTAKEELRHVDVKPARNAKDQNVHA